MSADTAALPAAPRPRTAALRRLTLTELTLFMRERVGIIWGIGFPLVLLIIFGNIPGFRKPVSPAAPRVSILDSYVPILLAFVLAMIALSVLPPVLADTERRACCAACPPLLWARSGCWPRSSSWTPG
jgi:ABC-2 type transport system permease protein